MEKKRVNTALKKARHLSYSEPVQSNSCPHNTFWKSNLIFFSPSTPGSFKQSLSLSLPHQNPTRTYPFPPICYAMDLDYEAGWYWSDKYLAIYESNEWPACHTFRTVASNGRPSCVSCGLFNPCNYVLAFFRAFLSLYRTRVALCM
jgi:hypothetical protein